MTKIANHLHRYKKINIGSKSKPYFVYRCQKPACSHYVPIHLAEGKLCECNRCGEPMILGKIQLNGSSGKPLARPHCNNCIQKKENTNVDAIAEFLRGKIGS